LALDQGIEQPEELNAYLNQLSERPVKSLALARIASLESAPATRTCPRHRPRHSRKGNQTTEDQIGLDKVNAATCSAG